METWPLRPTAARELPSFVKTPMAKREAEANFTGQRAAGVIVKTRVVSEVIDIRRDGLRLLAQPSQLGNYGVADLSKTQVSPAAHPN